MTPVLFLHLTLISVWLGCILVEAIYEHSIDHSDGMRLFISKLHWATDKYVEIPAFLGVLVTGSYMLTSSIMTPLLWVKVVFGMIAIIFNAICVGLVVKRLACAKAGDFKGWESLDHKQHKYGAVVLIALVIALIIGGYVLARA
jgi:hypothetical protein